MRKIGKFFLWTAFSALILLAFSTLVEEPVMLAPKPDVPPVSENGILTLGEVAAFPAFPEILQEVRTERWLPPEEMHCREYNAGNPDSPECDGNGSPLLSRSYVRTAYNACPMEDMPG